MCNDCKERTCADFYPHKLTEYKQTMLANAQEFNFQKLPARSRALLQKSPIKETLFCGRKCENALFCLHGLMYIVDWETKWLLILLGRTNSQKRKTEDACQRAIVKFSEIGYTVNVYSILSNKLNFEFFCLHKFTEYEEATLDNAHE